MTDLLLLVAIIAVCLFCLLVALLAVLPPLKKKAQENKLNRMIMVTSLGAIVYACVFTAITFSESITDYMDPPHGVTWELWDDFENMESGIMYTDPKSGYTLDVDDASLALIEFERMARYLFPPFMRKYCYTGTTIGCVWADIDITNFQNKMQWIDYLLRVCLGLLAGCMTGILAWLFTEPKTPATTLAAG